MYEKYLLIFEDGSVKVSSRWHVDWKSAVDAGALEVIDIASNSTARYTQRGIWSPLEETDIVTGY